MREWERADGELQQALAQRMTEHNVIAALFFTCNITRRTNTAHEATRRTPVVVFLEEIKKKKEKKRKKKKSWQHHSSSAQ